eukprot:scaffold19007_cov71-Phaeocystis_antarctica.AAC.7
MWHRVVEHSVCHQRSRLEHPIHAVGGVLPQHVRGAPPRGHVVAERRRRVCRVCREDGGTLAPLDPQ